MTATCDRCGRTDTLDLPAVQLEPHQESARGWFQTLATLRAFTADGWTIDDSYAASCPGCNGTGADQLQLEVPA